MTILSIDVGIKNLAYCLLDDCAVYKWGVVNLVESEKHMCCAKLKGGEQCKSEAKFTKNDEMFCLKHAKKGDYIVPKPELKPSNIKKMDIIKLKALADKYSIEYDFKLKKKELIQEMLLKVDIIYKQIKKNEKVTVINNNSNFKYLGFIDL